MIKVILIVFLLLIQTEFILVKSSKSDLISSIVVSLDLPQSGRFDDLYLVNQHSQRKKFIFLDKNNRIKSTIENNVEGIIQIRLQYNSNLSIKWLSTSAKVNLTQKSNDEIIDTILSAQPATPSQEFNVDLGQLKEAHSKLLLDIIGRFNIEEFSLIYDDDFLEEIDYLRPLVLYERNDLLKISPLRKNKVLDKVLRLAHKQAKNIIVCASQFTINYLIRLDVFHKLSNHQLTWYFLIKKSPHLLSDHYDDQYRSDSSKLSSFLTKNLARLGYMRSIWIYPSANGNEEDLSTFNYSLPSVVSHLISLTLNAIKVSDISTLSRRDLIKSLVTTNNNRYRKYGLSLRKIPRQLATCYLSLNLTYEATTHLIDSATDTYPSIKTYQLIGYWTWLSPSSDPTFPTQLSMESDHFSLPATHANNMDSLNISSDHYNSNSNTQQTDQAKPLDKLALMSASSSLIGDNSINVNNKSRHIVLVTIEFPPFIMKRVSENGTVEWYGYCIDFFQELVRQLPYKLTYEIYQSADDRFGAKMTVNHQVPPRGGQSTSMQPVKRWNGLVGELQTGRAHVALAPMAVMAERELVIDYTVPFYDLVGIQILLKRPVVPSQWFKFLTVLEDEVWLFITLAYFVTSFIMYLFDRLSPYSQHNKSRIQRLRQKRQLQQQLHQQQLHQQQQQPLTQPPQLTTLDSGQRRSSVAMTIENDRVQPLQRDHKLTAHVSRRRRPSNTSLSTLKSLAGGDKNPPMKNNVNDYHSGQHSRKQSRAQALDHNYWPAYRHAAYYDGDSSDDEARPDFGLRDSLWFCITSMTPQGGGEAPQNLSGRIVAGAWWLFCFIIIASYTANLAAFLTVSRLDIPIESLDDLAGQYKIKYAPVDGTATRNYFERMAYIEERFYNIWKEISLNDSLSEFERAKFAVWDYPISDKYTKIWAQIQQTGMPVNAFAGLKRVQDSNNIDDGFALLADANFVKYAAMTDCTLKSVGEEFSRKPIALGVKKGETKLRDDLSLAILKLINQRFMEVLREKWWTNNPNRLQCNTNQDSEGISIDNIGGVFVIIFVGVIISFLALAFEQCYYKNKMNDTIETTGRIDNEQTIISDIQTTNSSRWNGDLEQIVSSFKDQQSDAIVKISTLTIDHSRPASPDSIDRQVSKSMMAHITSSNQCNQNNRINQGRSLSQNNNPTTQEKPLDHPSPVLLDTTTLKTLGPNGPQNRKVTSIRPIKSIKPKLPRLSVQTQT